MQQSRVIFGVDKREKERTHDEHFTCSPIPDNQSGTVHPKEEADDVVDDLDERAPKGEVDRGLKFDYSSGRMWLICSERS